MRLFVQIGLFFALVVGSPATAEEPAWVLSADRRTIALEMPPPISAELRLAGAVAGIAMEVGRGPTGRTELTSTWPLMLGTAYELRLKTDGAEQVIALRTPHPETPRPSVAGISPRTGLVPANALRLYLSFDTPMARGQAAEFVRLIDRDGREMPNAFLNIGVELWSADQRRLTLLFDPGRLKQGVGPNVVLGAPLAPGVRYGVQVGQGMRDAMGRALSRRDVQWFGVGAAVRHEIEPQAWSIAIKDGAARVWFDRPMDAHAALRSVHLSVSDGRNIAPTTLQADGSLTWSVAGVGLEEMQALVVSPDLEDIAGNTICAPFDAAAGQRETCSDPVRLTLR